MMDLNKVAEEIAELEGKKEEQNIAQIKETLKCALIVLNRYEPWDILKTTADTAARHA
jgi:hypothetical protein